MYPKGGGKGRKRLYEEGLTAGAVTAVTAVAVGKGRGNFVGNKGLLCRWCCGEPWCRGCGKRSGGNVPSFGRMAV